MSHADQEREQTVSRPTFERPQRGAVAGQDPSLRGRTLTAMAPVVQLGFFVVGIASGLHELSLALERPGSPESGLFAAGCAAVSSVVFYGLLGWLAGRLLPAAAEILDQREEARRSSSRIVALFEDEMIPSFHRLADVLERRLTSAASLETNAPRTIADVRAAIRAGNWALADELIARLEEQSPDDAEINRLRGELNDSKRATGQGLLAKLAAAREASDPEHVIEHRESLVGLIPDDELLEIDRDLAKWFMSLIHKRLRAGNVRADVAILAGRVAQSLDKTPEGASLRAALPTLRRSAGLCARCAQPYTGIADACPACLGAVAAPTYQTSPADDLPDEE